MNIDSLLNKCCACLDQDGETGVLTTPETFCAHLFPSNGRHKMVQVLSTSSEIMSMIRKYHNHKLQTNPRHREEEMHNIIWKKPFCDEVILHCHA